MPYLLGRAPKQPDPRTIRYRAVMAPFPALPAAYSWDLEHPGAVITPVYANDRLGCCVISGRAHHTNRMEFDEAGHVPGITDAEVEAEYFAESGGADNGLVVLYSLRDWRNKGWVAGGKRYFIHSFMSVMPQDMAQVKESIIVGTGDQFGISLPISAADQLNAGAPWDVVAGPRGVPNSWGGHLVHGSEYDDEGVTVETWGKKQKMTWRFIEEYVDEAWVVFDKPNGLSLDSQDRLADALGNL